MAKYNLFFVPHFEDRKKISKLRSKICQLVHSTQALQYPVHMSLISGGFYTKNYPFFEKSLRELCKKENSLKLRAEKFTAVLPDRFWTGIHIIRNNKIKLLQKKLQVLRNKFADKTEKPGFIRLHITLAFPAEVDGLDRIKSPIELMNFDRITIVKKENETAPYRIFKHIKIA